LDKFPPDEQADMAAEALKVGVIAIQSASPTLDTRVVEEKFGEIEDRIKEQVTDFEKELRDHLEKYFKENDGVIPRSITDALGEGGTLSQTFQSYFDPNAGKVARLIEDHVGPNSKFWKALDPKNKEGIISLIEKTVRDLVEPKIAKLLAQFS